MGYSVEKTSWSLLLMTMASLGSARPYQSQMYGHFMPSYGPPVRHYGPPAVALPVPYHHQDYLPPPSTTFHMTSYPESPVYVSYGSYYDRPKPTYQSSRYSYGQPPSGYKQMQSQRSSVPTSPVPSSSYSQPHPTYLPPPTSTAITSYQPAPAPERNSGPISPVPSPTYSSYSQPPPTYLPPATSTTISYQPPTTMSSYQPMSSSPAPERNSVPTSPVPSYQPPTTMSSYQPMPSSPAPERSSVPTSPVPSYQPPTTMSSYQPMPSSPAPGRSSVPTSPVTTTYQPPTYPPSIPYAPATSYQSPPPSPPPQYYPSTSSSGSSRYTVTSSSGVTNISPQYEDVRVQEQNMASPDFIPILSLKHQIIGTEENHVEFHTGNGIESSETTIAQRDPHSDRSTLVKTGKVSWTSPEGSRIRLVYRADENGYHPSVSEIDGRGQRSLYPVSEGHQERRQY